MQKISELRFERGMTQGELANATGISLRTIQRIESGQVKPRAYSLKKIAEALKVESGDLHSSEQRQRTNPSHFFTSDRRHIFTGIFYSVWATIIFILLLLNIASQIRGIQYRSILFNNDLYFMGPAIVFTCFFTLVQIYLLLFRKRVITSAGYWVSLVLFSATAVYLKYASDFIDTAYLTLNNFQYYLSFVCWLILLFLGVTYKSLFKAGNVEQVYRP